MLHLDRLEAWHLLQQQLEESAETILPEEVQSPQSPSSPSHALNVESSPGEESVRSPRDEASPVTESSGRWSASPSSALRRELAEAVARRAESKAAWSRSVRHASTAEAREERWVKKITSELEETGARAQQMKKKFAQERDRLRQRVRNLRMQHRQAERKATLAASSAFGALEAPRERVPERFRLASTEEVHSVAELRPSGATASVPPRGGVRAVPAEPRRREEHLEQTIARLADTHQQLKQQTAELQSSAQLSQREIGHMESVSVLRTQLQTTNHSRRQERQRLRQVELQLHQEQHRCSAARGSVREMTAELRHVEQRQAEPLLEAPVLCEWLEAEIGLRQVDLVKTRLSTLQRSQHSREEVLDTAITEIHADLDHRAEVILHLAQRAREAPPSSAAERLEVDAVQAELLHQREIFDLRCRQAEALKGRKDETTTATGLKVWLAWAQPYYTQEWEALNLKQKEEIRQREDLEELEARRRHLEEVNCSTSQEAQEAANAVSQLSRQRELILKQVDDLSREERAQHSRLEHASSALQRDRRRAVEQTLRQLRGRGTAWTKEERASATEEAQELVEAARERQIAELQALDAETAEAAMAMAWAKSELQELAERQKVEPKEVPVPRARSNSPKVAKTKPVRQTAECSEEPQAAAVRGDKQGRAARSEADAATDAAAAAAAAEAALRRHGEAVRGVEAQSAEEEALLRMELQEAQESLRRCQLEHQSHTRAALQRFREDEREAEELHERLEAEESAYVSARLSVPVPSEASPRRSNPSERRVPSASRGSTRERFPSLRGSAGRSGPILEQKEVQSFYSQVNALQGGLPVRALRPRKQTFEEKMLVLSSDLQRLELWPKSASRRVADAFLRLESLSHVHLPGVEAKPKAEKSRLAVDLIPLHSSPWHLLAADAATFELLLAGVRALLRFRTKLPELALLHRQDLLELSEASDQSEDERAFGWDVAGWDVWEEFTSVRAMVKNPVALLTKVFRVPIWSQQMSSGWHLRVEFLQQYDIVPRLIFKVLSLGVIGLQIRQFDQGMAMRAMHSVAMFSIGRSSGFCPRAQHFKNSFEATIS
ncbi:unnamed protein product [Durusdinium trenchii]|uniref:Uncharacterized protein n=2 Tax=Durusdinium trenchii TaxID=1381693 RepID=A0ABP0LDV1_9DINO